MKILSIVRAEESRLTREVYNRENTVIKNVRLYII